ncbi:hypothetical protein [Novosphingobium sp.]|uniref:hypothetical protein n=1 Tax=Novosphingobium sp. TaxID=1874826 RepID=UPI0031D7C9E6
MRSTLIEGFVGTFTMAGYMGSCIVAIGRGVPTGLVALMPDMLPLAIALFSISILGQQIPGRNG